MSFVPAHEDIGDGPRLAVLLHGILGNRKNLRSLAARLVAARPDFRVRLIDHRNHGDSGPAPGAHTLEACVDDALALEGTPEVVVGHSFGGKVALAWARRRPAGLRQVWSLDSPPFAMTAPTDGVPAVLAALRRIPLPFARRNDVVDACLAEGLELSIGRWMTTNLRRDDDGFRWVFDLDAAQAMIDDYFRQDFADVLASSSPEALVVRAARSDRWPDEWVARLPAARYLVLPDAGHWLHVDNPDGLLAMLVARWPAETP